MNVLGVLIIVLAAIANVLMLIAAGNSRYTISEWCMMFSSLALAIALFIEVYTHAL